MFDLTGRTALITGSSRGLGFSIAEGLAQAGATLVLNGSNPERLTTAATSLRTKGHTVHEAPFDVTNEEAVQTAFANLDEKNIAIDILFNNAGIQLRGPLIDQTAANWRLVIETNLTSAFLVGREAAKRMIARGRGGKIINTGSLTSAVARATTGPYTAAKGGIKMLTQAMTAEWAEHNIQANAIGPGYMLTEMTQPLADDPKFDGWVKSRTPSRRWGTPADLIGTAIYLSSSASDYVNGQIIYVDGGMLAVSEITETTMKKLSRRTLLSAAVAAPAVIGYARAATTLKISTSFPNDPKFSTGRIWYDLFVPKLAAATDGQITTQFYPDNQLGQEADVANQVKLGVVDIMLAGTPIWTNMVPELGVYDLGYVFQDFDHMRRAAATPAGTALEALLLQKTGAHLPSIGRNLGARNFFTKFAFTDPAGLAGHKVRCLPSPVVTETVRLMGAAATPLAFGEIYTGLQAGVIEGLEHDAPTILASKFYETAKIFTLTRHIYTPFGAFVSDRTLQRVPSALRDPLLTAMRTAMDEHFARAAQVELDAIEQLKTKGVTVADCDRAIFRDRVHPMWDRFVERTPGAKDMLAAIHQTETA